ncbi:GntR family transcriptional regulator [Bombilactobacillus thymidiniphilus]|uniref:GntR family transcriptional regulator n=1 Tax=Bombilactobacillus thymidiniphilus TaxID=2923363 RepID=A0ABY4PC34_9LACO|nr:GntR family transcriptional regulator [Bombilactobacillus thymidiniphilus]UQS83101.1 GntR family transcriptional regulator [Bombilactobacillus thymidiniphilus]
MKNDFILVKEQLKHAITWGKYPPAAKLPTEDELMAYFQVSRYATRKALLQLEQEQLIYRIQGSGIYVCDWQQRWQPNPTSNTIGLLCTHIADYIFPQIISQIDSIIAQKGYSLLVANTHNDPQKERLRLINFLDSQVAGLIVEPSASAQLNPNLDIYQTIAESHIPLLFLNAHYPQLDFPSIENDDYHAEQELTNYLITMGHRQILGIFQIDDRQGIARMNGFQDALQAANIASDQLIMYNSHDVFANIAQQVKNLLIQNTPPTAIVCYNDELAMRIAAKLKTWGFQIPNDISLAGFDDYEAARYVSPSLTSLSYDSNTVGKQAGQAILRLLRGQTVTSIINHPQLKTRESVQELKTSFR